MNRFLSGPLCFAAALAAVPAPAAAQQTLDTTIAVRSGTRLELVNVSGSVTVRAGRRPAFRIAAEYDRARIEISTGTGSIEVRTVPRRQSGEVEFTIEVPEGTPLDVNAVSGEVDVRGVCGPAELRSFSGGVTLDCGRGDVELFSLSGEVSATDVRGRLEATSTSGEVTVDNSQGAVVARSTSGSVTLTRITSSDVTAETVSGEVEYEGTIQGGGRYRFGSHSGDVSVRVAERNLDATISVETFSGDIESDWPITLTQGGGHAHREFQFAIGSGSARVWLRSFSGTIHLRRGSSGRED